MLVKRSGRIDEEIAMLHHKLKQIEDGLTFVGRTTKHGDLLINPSGPLYQHTYNNNSLISLGNVHQHTYNNNSLISLGDVHQHTYNNNSLTPLGKMYQHTQAFKGLIHLKTQNSNKIEENSPAFLPYTAQPRCCQCIFFLSIN